MPALILMTCGTSIITNGLAFEIAKQVRQLSNESNLDGVDPDFVQQITDLISERRTMLAQADVAQVRKMSAELNGLLAWQAQRPVQPQDMYVLVATDTWFGKQTALMIQEWLKAQGHQVQTIEEKGLRTSNLNEFRESLSGLTKQLVDSLTGYKQSGYEIYFNLTGGFKGLNAFLQAVASLYADQTFYFFEGGQELLYIPKLPIKLNAEALIEENLTTFRRMNNELNVTPKAIADIPETLLFYIDDTVTLSEWGELIWQSYYKALYQQQIHPSISPQVVFEEGFINSTKKLDTQLKYLINRQIDRLAKYAEEGFSDMLKSLDLKSLQSGQYKKDKLLECDLDDHHRIFLTREGNTLYLKEVGAALH